MSLPYFMHCLWILKFPCACLGVHKRKSTPSLWPVRNPLTPNIYATHVTWLLCRSAVCLTIRGTGSLWMLYCSFGTSGPQLVTRLTPLTPLTPQAPVCFLARTVYEILLVCVFVVWVPQSFWSRLEFVIMVIWEANNLCNTCFVNFRANRLVLYALFWKKKQHATEAAATHSDTSAGCRILRCSVVWFVVVRFLPRHLITRSFLVRLIFAHEDGDDTCLRNISLYTDYAPLYPPRWQP
jgi:hypothetical protein